MCVYVCVKLDSQVEQVGLVQPFRRLVPVQACDRNFYFLAGVLGSWGAGVPAFRKPTCELAWHKGTEVLAAALSVTARLCYARS